MKQKSAAERSAAASSRPTSRDRSQTATISPRPRAISLRIFAMIPA